MSPVTADTVLVQDGEPTRTRLDQDLMMLSARAGAYFGLNRVGRDIWEMLATPCSVRQIHQALLQRYDVDADVMTREVSAFLQDMLGNGLVRVSDQGKTG